MRPSGDNGRQRAITGNSAVTGDNGRQPRATADNERQQKTMGDNRRQREATGDNGRAPGATGGDGRQRETTGGHGREGENGRQPGPRETTGDNESQPRATGATCGHVRPHLPTQEVRGSPRREVETRKHSPLDEMRKYAQTDAYMRTRKYARTQAPCPILPITYARTHKQPQTYTKQLSIRAQTRRTTDAQTQGGKRQTLPETPENTHART